MSGQAAQINQAGSGGVGGADGLPQHQQMQDVVGLAGLDPQFVMLRKNMREKIFEYIGRRPTSADWRRRLPELSRRLEEILFRKFSNKNDYYNMMNGPVEPQLEFAIKTLQQNQQMSRQIASSSGYGTIIPTPGITQGTNGNSRMPYGMDNTGLSSSGAGMVPQNASMGTSLPGSVSNGYQHLTTSVPLNSTTSSVPSAMGPVGIQRQVTHMIPTPGFNNQQNVPANPDYSSGAGYFNGDSAVAPHMQDVVDLAGLDPQFVILRKNMREKIFEYIGRRPLSADWRRRLPELSRRLEEILFTNFSNKNDYYNIMNGPVEPPLEFAVKTLQQHQQMSRQIASSSGYGTMIPTPGITQDTSGNSRMPYVTDSTGLSSSGAGMVPQNASMGTL